MYLIQDKSCKPFCCSYFNYAKHYVEGMIVYDLNKFKFTKDRKQWDDMDVNQFDY